MYVTAAHCSRTVGALDGHVYYQPFAADRLPIDLSFGGEYVDPPTGQCDDPSAPGRIAECRWSDALLIGADARKSQWRLGGIYRPLGVGTFGTQPGEYRINPVRPTLPITGQLPFPNGNEFLDHVGAFGGWTYGPVTRTCVNSKLDVAPKGAPSPRYVVFWCQDYVAAYATLGDSGGPVFYFEGENSVKIVGVVSAHQVDPTTNQVLGFSFSSMWNINYDIPNLRVN